MKQTLSVIIPARNAANTLGNLLDRLLELPMPTDWQVEIIVVYTDSDDSTLDVINARPVQLSHHRGKIGPGAARNTGAETAKGSLIYFIDADAIPVGKDFYEILIAQAMTRAEQGRFGGLGGPVVIQADQHRNLIAVADHYACWFNWTTVRPAQATRLFQPTVSLLMPASVFHELNGFDESLRVLEDYDLHDRVLKAGYRTYFEPDLAVAHHARDTLLKSWRHSWYWGAPYRSAYLARVGDPSLEFSERSKWFYLNLPGLYWRRMRRVIRATKKEVGWQTLWLLPFLGATVLSWSIAAIFGRGQPQDDKPHAA